MSTSEAIQRQLRSELRQAQQEGVIGSFALRPGGRATIYHVDAPTKCYTTSTLDTLATLEHLRKERMKT